MKNKGKIGEAVMGS